MTSALTEVMYFIASYAGVAFIVFFWINYISKGLLSSILKVKLGKGKRVLVNVHTNTDRYYTVGTTKDKHLEFYDRNKEKKLITSIPDGSYYTSMSCFCIDFDAVDDTIIIKGSEKVSSYDASYMAALLKKAIMTGTDEEKILKAIMVVAVMLLIIGGIIIYYVYKNNELISQLGHLSGVI